MSHPTWVRGLKFLNVPVYDLFKPSHPTWVRGLKYDVDLDLVIRLPVAPHVGAWIEIRILMATVTFRSSHPTWVRGLKYGYDAETATFICRTPRGCVD